MHFYRGSGKGAAKYFDEGHRGAEAYYSDEGRVAVEIDAWRAGERVGTTVLAEPGDLVKWVEGIDPATGEVKGWIRSGGADRQPLRFVEVVVNNPKSLSIVASQDPVVAAVFDRVLDRQADEIAKYLSQVAVTRTGPRGHQVEVGGLRVETARVRHLTSREGDPHRHVHLMLNTRVLAPDGTWRGLHSAAIRQHIRAINERGSRIVLSDRELREVLAERGYTLGGDGEVDQARDAVAALSKRTVLVADARDALEAEWRAEHPGREPSQRVRNGWDQEAWEATRRPKPVVRETPEQTSERVRAELADLGYDFTVDGPGRWPVLDWAAGTITVGGVDREALADHAVAALSGQKSAWATAELTAQVEATVARATVVGDAQAVTELVEDVRSRAAERCVSILDSEAWTPTVMSRYLTSPAVIDADSRLNLGLAGLAGLAGGGRRDEAAVVAAAGEGLDGGQVEAVAAVAGTARLEVVIGPAGAGKTAMLGAAKARLDDQGRAMVIVSPTRKGALVAGAEVGVAAASLSKLLYDHGWRWDQVGRWSRLAAGDVDPATGRPYQPLTDTVVDGRSVIVVDEAGLVTVDAANALIDLAAETGAAVRLVGDPRQLGAIGRGGVMETAARWVEAGPVVLDQVHRFLRVDVDETGLPVTVADTDYAELSLRLRDGVGAETVAGRLFERGAVIVHASEADAVGAIAAHAATAVGDGELAVTVATNDDAAKINQAARARRVAAGDVDDTRTVTGMDGVAIGAGDRIVTRVNDTDLGVANRETWIVTAVGDDGALAVVGAGGRRARIDSGYTARGVQLGYAVTDYGNQGVTVDRAHTWVTAATTTGGLYVGATRGRWDNVVHVVAGDHADARDVLVATMGRDRADRGLDAARRAAQSDAVPATQRAEQRRAAIVVDPGWWRTEAELAAQAENLEARLAVGLRRFFDVPVMPDDVRERQNHADRAAATDARDQAAHYRAEADRITARHDELVNTATVELFAARDAARIVHAGLGRRGRRAQAVEAAQTRLERTVRQWGILQAPGARWPDDTIRRTAVDAATRLVNSQARHQIDLADQAEDTAGAHDRRITARDEHQHSAVVLNQRRVDQRETLIAAIERDRATLTHHLETRATLTSVMTPDEISIADTARMAYLSAQHARQLTLGRGPHPDIGSPSIEPDGPSIEM
jgi:exodeoxyribonuclease V alpha subunit